MSEKGYFQNPKKSPYSVEKYDSLWELEYMKYLESDSTIAKWTKNHAIWIPYIDEKGNQKKYHPDFLIERTDGVKELREIKGTHMLNSLATKRKKETAKRWGKARGIEYVVISKHR